MRNVVAFFSKKSLVPINNVFQSVIVLLCTQYYLKICCAPTCMYTSNVTQCSMNVAVAVETLPLRLSAPIRAENKSIASVICHLVSWH